jgi:hypothetical protein
VQRQDVGLPEHPLEGRVAEAEAAGGFLVRMHVESDDLHPEALGDPDRAPADAAGADHAEGAAAQVETAQPGRREILPPGALDRLD